MRQKKLISAHLDCFSLLHYGISWLAFFFLPRAAKGSFALQKWIPFQFFLQVRVDLRNELSYILRKGGVNVGNKGKSDNRWGDMKERFREKKDCDSAKNMWWQVAHTRVALRKEDTAHVTANIGKCYRSINLVSQVRHKWRILKSYFEPL